MVERNNIYWEYCACLLSLPSRKCGLKYHGKDTFFYGRGVTSFAEVWIEIFDGYWGWGDDWVTSFAEVWIEIWLQRLPKQKILVTSFAEVWIEIRYIPVSCIFPQVTSFAEVWIEIKTMLVFWEILLSLPSRKCGLKFYWFCHSTHPFLSLPSRKCGLKLS